MEGDQHLWRAWAVTIQRWGMENWLASLLEAFGPLTVLAAQLIYIAGPVFDRKAAEEHLAAAARMLEDADQTRAFARLLRENHSP
jgi:hypothetical protein